MKRLRNFSLVAILALGLAGVTNATQGLNVGAPASDIAVSAAKAPEGAIVATASITQAQLGA